MDGVRAGLGRITSGYIPIKAFSCYATVYSPDVKQPMLAIKNDRFNPPAAIQNSLIGGVQAAFNLHLKKLSLTHAPFHEKAKALLTCPEVMNFYRDFAKQLHDKGLVIVTPEKMVMSGALWHDDEYKAATIQVNQLLQQVNKWVIEQNNTDIVDKSYPSEVDPSKLKQRLEKLNAILIKLHQTVSRLWKNGVATWDVRAFHQPFAKAYLEFIQLQNQLIDCEQQIKPPAFTQDTYATVSVEFESNIIKFNDKISDIRRCVAGYVIEQELKNLRIRPGKDPAQDPSIKRIYREFDKFMALYQNIQKDYQALATWYTKKFSSSSPVLEQMKHAKLLELKADYLELEIEYIRMQLQTSTRDVLSHTMPTMRKEAEALRAKAKDIHLKIGSNVVFHDAVKEGDISRIHEALKNGADVNHQNLEGDTALHIAVRERNPEVLKLLLESGADDKINDDMLMTPAELIEELIKIDKENVELLACKELLTKANQHGLTM